MIVAAKEEPSANDTLVRRRLSWRWSRAIAIRAAREKSLSTRMADTITKRGGSNTKTLNAISESMATGFGSSGFVDNAKDRLPDEHFVHVLHNFVDHR